MSVLRLFSLRNLLLVCCTVGLILIVFKSVGIYHKISWIKLADQYYARQEWIPAEQWYSRAAENRYLSYQEQHIRSRLAELQPISQWNSVVSASASELQAAIDTRQFDSFLSAYERWSGQVSAQQQADDRFQKEYKQIQQNYTMEEKLQTGFTQFRQSFEEGLQQNLKTANYKDESHKWNLLRIPQAYWDTREPMQQYIRDVLESYDQTKLNRLAAAGNFTEFLNQAVYAAETYKQHDYQAPWIVTLAENGTRSVITKDIQAKRTAQFVAHARSFRDAASELGLDSSPVLTQISQQILSLQGQAASLSAAGQFQQAVNLYESLGTLEDMSEPIARTQIAWATADPVHLLQSSNASVAYEHVTGGVNWADVPVYSIATDHNNRLFFGKMSSDGAASVWSGEIGQTANQILSLTLEPRLSSSEQPVIVVQSGSAEDDRHQYSFYGLTGSGFRSLLSVAAAGYETAEDGSIDVHEPADGAAGQTDIYRPVQDGSYTLSDSRTDNSMYRSITAAEVASHPNETIQFSAEIISVDENGALARQRDSYVWLTGDMEFATGSFTIYGQFNGQFQSLTPEQSGAGADNTDNSPDSGAATDNEANGSADTGAPGMPDPEFEPEYGLGDTQPSGLIGVTTSAPVVRVDRIE
ncbi:hypothetical protein [Paenibacillus wulumuqiensis]|uniref:hypothetical protein n=1 Tax=Paenibacillus wulumuqiensis TaxID=1567107 RepID=UPI000619E06D|nr:hypothetical protein [Paenibacillus wulumuqiensis]